MPLKSMGYGGRMKSSGAGKTPAQRATDARSKKTRTVNARRKASAGDGSTGRRRTTVSRTMKKR